MNEDLRLDARRLVIGKASPFFFNTTQPIPQFEQFHADCFESNPPPCDKEKHRRGSFGLWSACFALPSVFRRDTVSAGAREACVFYYASAPQELCCGELSGFGPSACYHGENLGRLTKTVESWDAQSM